MARKSIYITVFLGMICLAGTALAVAGSYAWINFHPQPAPATQALFQGIEYTRQVRSDPRPMVIHVVTVDLRSPGLTFLVTPGDPDESLPLEARTTSQFLREFDLQLAVNGDGFSPWYSNSILDYYPHPGDRIEPIGFAASAGTAYSGYTDNEPVLYIARTNRARFNTPIGRVYNAISGNTMLVERGQALPGMDDTPQPRTALALDKAGRRLIIVVVDGRQPRYSQGATLPELAEIILEHGGYFGMNLDGGGSSTLVRESRSGNPVLLNSPIEHRIPGRQRAVGNHLGIFADPASDGD
jgi:hypothetical protein